MPTLLERLGGALLRVEIVALVEDTYMANMVVRKENQVLVIDCRPSDAITLAIRLDAPIFIAESILDNVGIEPEIDRQEAEQSESEPDISVFKDFFDSLEDTDKDSDKPKE